MFPLPELALLPLRYFRRCFLFRRCLCCICIVCSLFCRCLRFCRCFLFCSFLCRCFCCVCAVKLSRNLFAGSFYCCIFCRKSRPALVSFLRTAHLPLKMLKVVFFSLFMTSKNIHAIFSVRQIFSPVCHAADKPA